LLTTILAFIGLLVVGKIAIEALTGLFDGCGCLALIVFFLMCAVLFLVKLF
jgi:hypothetical protein